MERRDISNCRRTNKSLNVIPDSRVTLTAEAAEKIKHALEQCSASGVRIIAREKERGSLSFSFYLEQEARPDDLVLDEKGFKLFLDPSSTRHIKGIEIKYVETEKGSGFAIVNAASGCGPG